MDTMYPKKWIPEKALKEAQLNGNMVDEQV